MLPTPEFVPVTHDPANIPASAVSGVVDPLPVTVQFPRAMMPSGCSTSVDADVAHPVVISTVATRVSITVE